MKAEGEIAAAPQNIDCFTEVGFDFYYAFSGYEGNYSNWDFQVSSTFIIEFYHYLDFQPNLYYEKQPTSLHNSLIFYNMPNGGTTIGNIIYNGLMYAKIQCSITFNLTASELTEYLYFVKYSTCDSRPPDEGGGPIMNDLYVDDIPEQQEVFNGIDVQLTDDPPMPPVRLIGYSPPRGNVEDLQYGTDGNINLMPYYVRNLPDDRYFDKMTTLFAFCTTFDSDLRWVAMQAIEHFKLSTGSDFINAMLSSKARESSKTHDYLRLFGEKLNQSLLQVNGNINAVNPISMGDDRPKFDGGYNRFHGLQILVNDTEATDIILESFTSKPNNKWSAIVQVNILDHFGLDLHDVLAYQSTHDGFPSWWILQHVRNYRPFNTRMSFRLEVSAN